MAKGKKKLYAENRIQHTSKEEHDDYSDRFHNIDWSKPLTEYGKKLKERK